jgi:hypothetical protein
MQLSFGVLLFLIYEMKLKLLSAITAFALSPILETICPFDALFVSSGKKISVSKLLSK